MKIVLLGAPGIGKGTQASKIAKKYSAKIIATGDILRNAAKENTPLAKEIQTIMAKGELVPDPILLPLIKKAVNETKAKVLLFDGFPRTVAQAEHLHSLGVQVNHVIVLQVSQDKIISRLSGHWIHDGSGRVYHDTHKPPLKQGYDDVTGEPLTQRADDKIESIKQRLSVYDKTTAKVAPWYTQNTNKINAKIHSINAEQNISAVFHDICDALPKTISIDYAQITTNIISDDLIALDSSRTYLKHEVDTQVISYLENQYLNADS